MFTHPEDCIIAALDFPEILLAQAAVGKLEPIGIRHYKLGLEAICAGHAHELARTLIKLGHKVGWDIKLNDIPETTAAATRQIAQLGVTWFTVHASSSSESVRAAVVNRGRSKAYGVTVLTSIDEECCSIFGEEPGPKVLQFAHLLLSEGAQGIVCAAYEVQMLRRQREFDALEIIIPATRSTWAPHNDQKRVMTPRQAIAAGADYVIIGRSMTQPPHWMGHAPGVNDVSTATVLTKLEVRWGLEDRGEAWKTRNGIPINQKEVPCRFSPGCSSPAVGRYSTPEGCACFPNDTEMDLCAQHTIKAEPIGEMALLCIYQPTFYKQIEPQLW